MAFYGVFTETVSACGVFLQAHMGFCSGLSLC